MAVFEIVSTMLSDEMLLQGGFPVAVKVRITEPPAISPALGVYVGFRVLSLANVPVPELVHKSAP